MAIKSKAYIKSRFEGGDIPSGQDVIDLLDSIPFLLDDNIVALVEDAIQNGGISIPLPAVLPVLDGRNLTNLTSPAWLDDLSTPIFSSSTLLNLQDDKSAVYEIGRPVRLTVAGVFQYNEVLSSIYVSENNLTQVRFRYAIVGTTVTKISYGFLESLQTGGPITPVLAGAVPDDFRHVFVSDVIEAGVYSLPSAIYKDGSEVLIQFPNAINSTVVLRCQNSSIVGYTLNENIPANTPIRLRVLGADMVPASDLASMLAVVPQVYYAPDFRLNADETARAAVLNHNSQTVHQLTVGDVLHFGDGYLPVKKETQYDLTLTCQMVGASSGKSVRFEARIYVGSTGALARTLDLDGILAPSNLSEFIVLLPGVLLDTDLSSDDQCRVEVKSVEASSNPHPSDVYIKRAEVTRA
jgi:hypothetical protein